MKLYSHNFTEENIILNATIFYSFEENEAPILVKIPTIKESLEDLGFNIFLSLMFLKKEDYKKMKLLIKAESEGEGLVALIRENKEIREQVKPYIEKYLIGSEVSVEGIKKGGRVLKPSEINFFRKIILVSFGVEKLEIQEKEEEDLLSKMSPAEKAIYLRQQRTLKKLEEAKKRKQEARTDGQVNLSKIIVGVMKEFNMTIEEIKNLNYYTLYYLFSYVFKIDHYDFMKKAAASGNLTKKAKIKHWLE